MSQSGIVTLSSYTGSGYYTGLFINSRYSATCTIFIDGNEFMVLFAEDIAADDVQTVIDNSIVRFENSFRVDCSAGSGQQYRYSISYMTD